MAKNGKILAPTRTGNFFVDLNELGIIRDGCLVGGVKQLKQNLIYHGLTFKNSKFDVVLQEDRNQDYILFTYCRRDLRRVHILMIVTLRQLHNYFD